MNYIDFLVLMEDAPSAQILRGVAQKAVRSKAMVSAFHHGLLGGIGGTAAGWAGGDLYGRYKARNVQDKNQRNEILNKYRRRGSNIGAIAGSLGVGAYGYRKTNKRLTNAFMQDPNNRNKLSSILSRYDAQNKSLSKKELKKAVKTAYSAYKKDKK